MREILFRGKGYSGEWVNGNLFVDNKKERILHSHIGI